MHYRYRSYRYTDWSPQQLERHYCQLVQDVLQQNQQSLLPHSVSWRPLVDIYESVDMMTVKIELAGMSEEHIKVTLYEDALVVSGERHDDHKPGTKLSYRQAQICYGSFRVEVFLASPIDREAVQARYENGFLWANLPKLPKNRPERTRFQPYTTKALQ